MVNFIAYRIKKLHMSQAKLSDLTGISQNTISDYENYKCFPSLNHADILAKYLDCDLYYLFELLSCPYFDR